MSQQAPHMLRSIKSLWPHVRPFRFQLLWGVTLILASTAVEVAVPLVIGKGVDAALLPVNARQTLTFWCVTYLSLSLLKGVLESFQAYVLQSTGQSVTHELRSDLFAKVMTLKVAYFDKNPSGRLLTRVINDIKSLGELFTASISVLALDGTIIIGTVAAMFWVNAWLAAWVLATFPLVLLTIHYFGKKLTQTYRKVRLRLAEINAFLGENIGAIATIQRLSAEKDRMDRFTGVVAAHQDAQLESVTVFSSVQPITNVLNGVAQSTLLLVAGYEIVHDRLSVGILVAFLGYLRNLFQPIRDLVEKYNTFLSAGVSAERVAVLFQEESEETPVATARGARETADVAFDQVTFTYPTREHPAISGATFRIPSGSSAAIVGATGSGKSTLIRLMLRFYDPDSGSIRIGGQDVRTWSLAQLRRLLGVIHQDVYLFGATVRENLTLGAEGYLDPYLVEKCKRAQFWDVIAGRGGLEAPVLENGTNFSLGERQLLSFARTLVFDPPVLVLDEATANIDRILERRIMEAIQSLVKGRTSLIIAHRLSTIRHCDNVIVMERGNLVQEGRYDVLAKADGPFKKFHELNEFA